MIVSENNRILKWTKAIFLGHIPLGLLVGTVPPRYLISEIATDQTEIPRARPHLFFFGRLRHFSQAGIPQRKVLCGAMPLAPLAEGNAKKYAVYKAEVNNTMTISVFNHLVSFAYIYTPNLSTCHMFTYIIIYLWLQICTCTMHQSSLRLLVIPWP